ncbi:MAG: hypothetical protein WAO10_19755 [Candidatus Sulfotelmatobacter sp.]
MLASRPMRSQDSSSPPSLGDVARLSRSQRQQADTAPSKAQELADQLQQEQEESENAPVGYKTYNAGDYRLWVPFPYEVEGRDQIGTILAGSRVGVTNTEVMAGNPLAFPSNLDEGTERNLVTQVAGLYSQHPSCSPIKLGERRAYRCGLDKAYLMGSEVWGTMVFVISSGNVIPVMCVSPDDLHQCVGHDKFGYHTCGNKNPTWDEVQKTQAAVQTRYQDERTTAQVCDQLIYPSIRLREDYAPRALAGSAKSMDRPGAAKTAGLPTASGAQTAANGDAAQSGAAPSLADVVRQSKQASANQPKAKLTLDATDGGGIPPAGFKEDTFSYCQRQNFCWHAYVFLPANAVRLKDYAPEFVYEVPFDKERVLLFAGQAQLDAASRGSKDPTLALWREINATEGSAALANLQAATRDEATIAGMPGFLTHFEIKRNETVWVGIRANVVSRGVELMVGCLAPKMRFGDADQDCSTLIDSLRLP